MTMGKIWNMKKLTLQVGNIVLDTAGTISGGTSVNTVTAAVAAGSTNADAALLSAGTAVVTAADGTKGVILPAMTVGQSLRVKNNAAAILKVYPFSGAAINGLTATTGALSMAANTIALYVCTSATQVYSDPLLPS